MNSKKIIADTSIWIEYFNKPESKFGIELKNLLEQYSVISCGIILSELLSGAKDEDEFKLIISSMSSLPFLETSYKTWIKAGEIGNSLQKQRKTVPLTDVLISSLAIENDCEIFTLDSHFQQIEGINIYR